MNIPEVWRKFKAVLELVPEEFLLVLIIVLVGVASFGLGRLSISENLKESVHIIEPDSVKDLGGVETVSVPKSSGKILKQTASVLNALESPLLNGSEVVVGSKNGTKYHLPWCSGAKRINEENKVTFASKAEAEKAGYTAAANCPGL